MDQLASRDWVPLKLKQLPERPGSASAHKRHWQKFKNPVLLKQVAAVTSICFSPKEPHDYVVTSSTRLHLFSASTNEVVRSFTKFKDVVYGGDIRSDGNLLASGGEFPRVKIFDINTKTLLRTFKGHEKAIHVVKFSPNNTQILSGSDDRSVRCWDLATSTQISCLRGHQDHVRAATISSNNPDLWITGGYDHDLHVWDLRANQIVMTMTHEGPIEAIIALPAGNGIISAAKNEIKVWDILTGGRLLQSISNHQKTITSLAMDNTYLLSAGLDQLVKIYDRQTYEVHHTIKYSAPIMSMGVSHDSTKLVVGMSDGMLNIRTRPVPKQQIVKQKQEKEQFSFGTYRYFLKGKSTHTQKEDYVLRAHKKERLAIYDKMLKWFRYKEALDGALSSKKGSTVVSMIEELNSRNGLTIALSGRTQETLEPLLKFLISQITNPLFSSLLIVVAEELLDIYTPALGKSDKIDGLLNALNRKVKQEIRFQKQLFEVLGTLDLIMNSALTVSRASEAPKLI